MTSRSDGIRFEGVRSEGVRSSAPGGSASLDAPGDADARASERTPVDPSVAQLRGEMDGEGHRHAVVVARFNPMVTEALLVGAVNGLTAHGVAPGAVEVIRVPGAWELPGAAARIAERGGVDAILALGCVIRGETPHFDFVAGEAAAGLGRLSTTLPVPVIFGVLTTETLEQAMVRAGARSDDPEANKGWEVAVSAIEMVNLYRALR